MTLQPFARAAELQVISPSLDDAQAELAVQLASDAIRESIGWDVDKVTDATYTRTVPRQRRGQTAIRTLVLPAMNVTAVSVDVDGVTQAAADFDWDERGIIDLAYPGYEQVVVTYTAGYVRAPNDTAPGVLRACTLDYAVKFAENPGGIKAYSMGNVSETFAYNEARGYADEDPRLDRLRVDP